MAGLSTLPTEILHAIISNIPRRSFHTELLLLNKTLCCVFMIEQIRNLRLSGQQLDRWITIITNNDKKRTYLALQYCSLLDKVINLNIYAKNQPEETIVWFIGCCTNLRILTLRGETPLRWNASLIFNSLPFNIIELSIRIFSFLDGDKDFRSLVSYMKQNTKLKILYFEECEIGDKGAHDLAEGLKYNTALTSLILLDANIDAEGAYALAEALKQNTALTNLDLYNNKIRAKGAHALAEALKQNTALANLNLSWNNIGNEGANVLAKGLKQNTALIKLNLFSNYIGDDGAYALAEALKQNIALASLDLAANSISMGGAHTLAEALKQNTALTKLDLRANYIDFTLLKVLNQNTGRIII